MVVAIEVVASCGPCGLSMTAEIQQRYLPAVFEKFVHVQEIVHHAAKAVDEE
jgi:hypothetical protein